MAIRVGDVYRERAFLVAFLANAYPSVITPASDAEEGFTYVVVVDTPEGQMSWHIADTDLDLFWHLPYATDKPWDGHTTEEKYRRLWRLTLWVFGVGRNQDAIEQEKLAKTDVRDGGERVDPPVGPSCSCKRCRSEYKRGYYDGGYAGIKAVLATRPDDDPTK